MKPTMIKYNEGNQTQLAAGFCPKRQDWVSLPQVSLGKSSKAEEILYAFRVTTSILFHVKIHENLISHWKVLQTRTSDHFVYQFRMTSGMFPASHA